MHNLQSFHCYRGILRFVNLLMVFVLVVGLIGCAIDTAKGPDDFISDNDFARFDIKKVALVVDRDPPEIDSVDLGVTKGEGAVYGAAGGALAGVDAALTTGPGVVIALPIFAAIGVVFGTAGGVASGYSPDMLADAELSAQRILNSAYLQTQILERVSDYGHENTDYEFVRTPGADQKAFTSKPDYQTLSAESVDAVLEVKLLRLALEDSLEIVARVRIVVAPSGIVLSDSQYRFVSQPRRLEEWLANGAGALDEAIVRGLRRLAESAVDENFLLYYPSVPDLLITPPTDDIDEDVETKWGRDVPHYVLSPVYPGLDSTLLSDAAIGFRSFVEVDSVQPTLKWERFPREYDLIDVDGKSHEIDDVRYELRVFDSTKQDVIFVPSQQVYYVRDIQRPYHKIENALHDCSRYFWTVRARFRLDGRLRVTEWAGTFDFFITPWKLRSEVLSWSDKLDAVFGAGDVKSPEWFYYPFKTPCIND